jgi:hypothetical protein
MAGLGFSAIDLNHGSERPRQRRHLTRAEHHPRPVGVTEIAAIRYDFRPLVGSNDVEPPALMENRFSHGPPLQHRYGGVLVTELY